MLTMLMLKKKQVHIHNPSGTYFLAFKFSDILTQTKYYSVLPSLGNNYSLFTCSIQYPMAISFFFYLTQKCNLHLVLLNNALLTSFILLFPIMTFSRF